MSSCSCAPGFAAQARTRVKLQQPVLTDDGIGGKIKSWSDLMTVWAIVKAAPTWRRMEISQAQEIQACMQQSVTIRYIPSISDNTVAAKLRLVIGCRTMNVVGISNFHDDMKTEGKSYQTLWCVEGEAA